MSRSRAVEVPGSIDPLCLGRAVSHSGPDGPVLTKSGRTVLLNARITQRAHDRFHEIVEAERLRYERGEIMHRATLGEIVERALAALQREEGQGK